MFGNALPAKKTTAFETSGGCLALLMVETSLLAKSVGHSVLVDYVLKIRVQWAGWHLFSLHLQNERFYGIHGFPGFFYSVERIQLFLLHRGLDIANTAWTQHIIYDQRDQIKYGQQPDKNNPLASGQNNNQHKTEPRQPEQPVPNFPGLCFLQNKGLYVLKVKTLIILRKRSGGYRQEKDRIYPQRISGYKGASPGDSFVWIFHKLYYFSAGYV
jgi:hypothetical protein